jgi:electron transfer flavoprotein-quinone oxidoreductase
LEDWKVVGIVAGGDAIHANVIVAADGVMSVMAEKAGLKDGHPPENFAVGVKELIELPSHVIEERFNLEENEGAAQLFIGPLAQDIFGHGFLYTNLESISLGVVVGIKDLMTRQSPIELPQLIEDFRQHPEVLRLIKGGDIVEYSAHVIPEAGMGGIPHLYGDGIIVVGDAAGFALNMGITMRGMEFAIASGAMAAQAIKGAVGKGDFSKESLSIYEDLLKDSFVLKDLNTFKNAPRFLSNPALFNLYPQSICHLFEELMFIGEGPKQKVIDAKWSSLLKDLIGALKI